MQAAPVRHGITEARLSPSNSITKVGLTRRNAARVSPFVSSSDLYLRQARVQALERAAITSSTSAALRNLLRTSARCLAECR